MAARYSGPRWQALNDIVDDSAQGSDLQCNWNSDKTLLVISSSTAEVAFHLLRDNSVCAMLITNSKTVLCIFPVNAEDNTWIRIQNVVDAMKDGATHRNQTLLYSIFATGFKTISTQYISIPVGKSGIEA